MVFTFLLFSLTVPAAKAKLIGTETALTVAANEANRAKVSAFLERSDVQQIMVQHGVDVDEAQNRLDALTDAELLQLADNIDKLPTGGDAVGAVIGAVLVIFLVLLVTDILGLTHVFSFVNR